ncbi:DNA cytosine methyltransferase [Cellulosilyticum ruminicola]|uniref:DNA cytosine methyltransferase n=1 Tax=Cellulosilyticum ruminicola TaxID=425254 RepID=UPI0006D12E0E|nr:DNA (cytosine-5-)-methyltransferase [Cellulosilyticum ruminicola]
MPIPVVELFAGVGGFHVGLSRASEDFKVVWANQWEPSKKSQHAFECYASHFPETESINIDIAEVNNNPEKHPIPQHTLLVGGFPCQDYSVASTGAKGIEGKKGVLWWEIQKIVDRHRPPFILLENVDRLLKSPTNQRGRDFAVMLGCLRDLGYMVEWRVINAAEYGAGQRRRRIFIFAAHESTQYYKQVISVKMLTGDQEYLKERGFFAIEFPIKETSEFSSCVLDGDLLSISDEFSFSFGECGALFGTQIISQRYKPEEKAPVLLANILETNVDESFYLGENLADWDYMKGAKRINRTSKTGHSYIFSEGAIAFPDPIDRPARTMLTSESSKNRSTHVVKDPETGRLRVLTPVECERINGFPDNWTNSGMPQKFRYFCMGNALVVDLIEKMGRELKQIIEMEKKS